MKIKIVFVVISLILLSCNTKNVKNDANTISTSLIGTWKLLTGTLIEKGDTTITDYTKNKSFIKIINDTHFAFLEHDLNKGKDTAAVFASGAGTYSLTGNSYIEHLEYCSDRQWEGNNFPFTIAIKNDTLIISGTEKVESAGINRVNIEKYIKISASVKN